MIKAVIIARKEDAFTLCEYYDEQMTNYQNIRGKAKQFLQTQKGTASEPDFEFLKTNDNMYIHFMVDDVLIYQAICENSFPQKLAKAFLEEVKTRFFDVIAERFGHDSLRSKLMSIDEPYAFIRFDRQIKIIIQTYKDTGSDENMKKMQSDLYNIYNTMNQSLELLIDKGNSLNKMSDTAHDINDSAIKFKNKAEDVKRQLMFRKYMLWGILGALVVLFIFLKFF